MISEFFMGGDQTCRRGNRWTTARGARYTTRTPMARAKRLIIAALLVVSLSGCTNSDIAREQLRQESENNYGVMRTVTAYSTTGEVIGEWHGKIDVQYLSDGTYGANERIDVVVFDGSEPVDRIIISGATVIVDND